MIKLAFITGITGQDGSYLAELLLKKNYEIHGIVRRSSIIFNTIRIEHIRNKLNLHYGDLTDGSALNNLFYKIIKDKDIECFEIYNLGAQSHVKISFEQPEYTSLVDGIGVLKILETIRSLPKYIINKVRFYQAGTSEMFGKVLENPQTETTPFNPQSPYACAKVYSHYLVNNYRDAYKIYACNGILFNHESPRRGENFVTMKIVNGIKKIIKLEKEGILTNDHAIILGNIDSKRDWGHAKDYVYGMWLMLQQDKPDNYVLASGKTYTVRNFIERCFAKVGKYIEWSGKGIEEIGKDKISGKILIKIDQKYFRPCEVDYLLGNATKAITNLGWTTKYDINMLIDDMMK